MSQSLQILSHLKSGKSLTQIEALNLFGCMRLASRVDELRTNHDIITTMVTGNGKSWARYSLVG